jgi:hypothetical protein
MAADAGEGDDPYEFLHGTEVVISNDWSVGFDARSPLTLSVSRFRGGAVNVFVGYRLGERRKDRP